ncbi:hypothetical protein MLC59_13495 [Marinobacter bryozoorum]|uniref:hypothetical protein n=1 Tax=Marinobacter bryozoorum TaxID=256324 RepID=UPI0020033D15|nr:hypothetical protein [Marinobacter bryozoorum]MCK7545176.1 hypothetical protein [Marinobacter bryozoorum]
MSVGLRFQRELPKVFSGYGERDLIWLWYYLVGRGYQLSYSNFNDYVQMASDISSVLEKSSPYVLEEIGEEHNKSLIPDSELSFFDGADGRLSSWIFYKFKEVYRFDVKDDWLSGILGYQQSLLAALDTANISISQKRAIVRELRYEWSENLKLDVSYNWINIRDERLGFWLLEKLEENDLFGHVYGVINAPVTSEDRVLKFKCVIDRSDLSVGMKRAFINSLKAQWKARGRKKSKERVQSNVLVKAETKAAIKSLRAIYGYRSGGEVIDKLVADALSKLG